MLAPKRALLATGEEMATFKPVEIIAMSAIENAIDERSDALRELSRKIWSQPELAYEEHSAHDALTEFLEAQGFAVDRHYKLDTAFRAVFKQGHGSPHVVVICEYDALPTIGHACGHNLIAEAGVAAGLGLRAALLSGQVSGMVSIIGTPAEESGGGKIDLIKADAFAGVDAALMAHPDQLNMMAPIALGYNTALVTFTGRAAHAAAAPWDGLNALDAAINAYTSLSMLRQQMKPDCRMHAVITEGGVKPNIIPERAVLKYTVRSTCLQELSALKEKTIAIMKAAGQATGCDVDIEFANNEEPSHYSDVIHNPCLVERFQQHWEMLGERDGAAAAVVAPNQVWASTDMGNVSHVVPSIHPTFSIGTSANIHTREFTAAAMTEEAHKATRTVAKAMAMVGWDIMSDEQVLVRVKQGFRQQIPPSE